MLKKAIAKNRPVGRGRLQLNSNPSTLPTCPFRYVKDPMAELKWVMDCPHKGVVIKVEWFQPGTSNSWRETYVISYQHALAEFGSDLIANNIKLTILSVPKNGSEYEMAVSNHNVFVNRVKGIRAAQKAEEEKGTHQAADALVRLPCSE